MTRGSFLFLHFGLNPLVPPGYFFSDKDHPKNFLTDFRLSLLRILLLIALIVVGLSIETQMVPHLLIIFVLVFRIFPLQCFLFFLRNGGEGGRPRSPHQLSIVNA
jgi:hypothetical protein